MKYDSQTKLFLVEAIVATQFSSSTQVLGDIIDTKDFESITFILNFSNYASGTFVMNIEDGNESNLSDSEILSVNDDPQTLIPADSNNLKLEKNGFARIGYVGKKRYLRVDLFPVSSPVGDAYVIAILGNAKAMPTTDQRDA